jgi:hypothetical protein
MITFKVNLFKKNTKMLDIKDSFKFAFKDPDWTIKFLIGFAFSLLSLLLIGIPVINGYFIELVRRVMNNESNPLPEWKDPGIKFISGLKYIVVMFIYYLPLLIVVIPAMIILIIVSLSSYPSVDILESSFLTLFMILIIAPYSLFIYLLQPTITILFAKDESIRDAIQINRAFKLFKLRWEDVIVVSVLTLIFDFLAIAGLIFFIIGIFFTTFFVSLVRYHLYGQIGRELQKAKLI